MMDHRALTDNNALEANKPEGNEDVYTKPMEAGGLEPEDNADCFGISFNGSRKFFYIAVVCAVVLLILVTSAIAVIASDPGSATTQPNIGTGATESPTLLGGTVTASPTESDSTSAPTEVGETPSPSTSPTETFSALQGSKPNIVVVMMDDLGYHDVGYAPEPRDKVIEATPTLTNMAQNEGIILTRHYVHWHCSPSRRSFLTGRLPYRTGEDLSDVDSDDIDLRWTWFPEKLAQAGYKSYMFGKGHTGYKSYAHLPTQNGFDQFVGILTGKTTYTDYRLWENGYPEYNVEVSDYHTRYMRKQVQTTINQHLVLTPNDPFFLFLSLQTPHTPIEPPSITDTDYDDYTLKKTHPYEHMLYAADVDIGKLIDFFKNKGLWDDTFFVFTSDNGATTKDLSSDPDAADQTRGSNYPLRGDKSTNFEGGMRATAFVAGGVIPDSVRGTSNDVVSHIADWYATFCYLAGVDDSDDPPEQPITPTEPVDPMDPRVKVNGVEQSVWGANSYPGSDSLNLMPHLLEPGQHPELRPEGLILTYETIVQGDYKLILAMPCAFDLSNNCKPNKLQGWIEADGKTINTNFDSSWGCLNIYNPLGTNEKPFEPCLFNLATDIREESPIQNSAKMTELWQNLNNSLTFQYNKYVFGKSNGLSPTAMVGSCRSTGNAGDCLGADRDKDILPLCGIANSICV